MIWLIPIGCLVLWMILTAIEKPKRVVVINDAPDIRPDIAELGKELDQLSDMIKVAREKIVADKKEKCPIPTRPPPPRPLPSEPFCKG